MCPAHAGDVTDEHVVSACRFRMGIQSDDAPPEILEMSKFHRFGLAVHTVCPYARAHLRRPSAPSGIYLNKAENTNSITSLEFGSRKPPSKFHTHYRKQPTGPTSVPQPAPFARPHHRSRGGGFFCQRFFAPKQKFWRTSPVVSVKLSFVMMWHS